MELKSLTVFTPTYNRAYCLPRCYESLCRQTSKDFRWLVIDDGSSDNTHELLKVWIKEGIIPIDYVYQENQGMHGAHNTAYKNISTKYNVCIDSDDYMPDNSVEIILKNTRDLSETHAGLVGLDADTSGNIIGNKIPAHWTECSYARLYHNVKGDKKLVYKTKIVKEYPEYPLFKGERFVPLGYLYYLIDQSYKLKPINEVLASVDYQEDGSTRNIYRQYMLNPRGFAFTRISAINLPLGLKVRLKNAIHLVSCAILTKDLKLLKESKKPMLMLLAFPFGLLLNVYIRIRVSAKKA